MSQRSARPVRSAEAAVDRLEELYAAYTACLDEERFEEWPEFFVEQCLYKIVPRENFERGLPLATWLCEGIASRKPRPRSSACARRKFWRST